MHLTRFTDLSLRVLIYLTHNERKGLVTKCCKLRSLLNEATRDFYSRLNTATLETLTNSDEIREIISGKDLLRAQPDAPTPPSSELIRLMEARVARELRKARQ